MVDQEQEENISHNSLLSVVSSTIKMSSSLTSLSLASPTDKAAPCGGIDGAVAGTSGAASAIGSQSGSNGANLGYPAGYVAGGAASAASSQSGSNGASLNGNPF